MSEIPLTAAELRDRLGRAPDDGRPVILMGVSDGGHQPAAEVRDAAVMRVVWPDGSVSWCEPDDPILVPDRSDDPETLAAIRGAETRRVVLIDW
ncbi:MAG: hypothetical protein F4Z29_00530 [Gemmatimonadetes bacterium]|nr:hypothetical protein [Gemmatimonadota bacterium]